MSRPSSAAVGDQFGGEGDQKGFPAGEDNRDRSEPAPQIAQNCFPLFKRRPIFSASVFPDVAMHAPCVAAPR